MSPKTPVPTPVTSGTASRRLPATRSGEEREEDGVDKEEKERRRQAFQDFVSHIPRICSPSLAASATSFPCPNSPQSLDPDFQFNWSIDQIAALEPAHFSNELNGSFYRLDQSVEQELQQEDQDFFDRSRVLPSPDTQHSDANDGLTYPFSPRICSMSRMGTPSRGFGDMSVSQTKVPTPVNVSKTRQKKKKLFSDDSLMCEAVTDSQSNSNCTMDWTWSRSESRHRLVQSSMPELSPILGDGTRVLEMGTVDDTFCEESKSISVMVTSSCCDSIDCNERRSGAAAGLAAFQTSTPTQRHS